jgi:hypothetical protein
MWPVLGTLKRFLLPSRSFFRPAGANFTFGRLSEPRLQLT